MKGIEKIKKHLKAEQYDAIAALAGGAHAGKVLRQLVSMSYDKSDILSWRAMVAIGRVTADMSEDDAREVIQKVLWMMRDESGGNAWSGPEIIGEILRSNPGRFKDMVAVLFSFHEEPFFLPGVLWAFARLAKSRKEDAMQYAGEAREFLGHEESLVRAHASLFLARFDEYAKDLKALRDDESEVVTFDGSNLVSLKVGYFLQNILR